MGTCVSSASNAASYTVVVKIYGSFENHGKPQRQ